MGHCPIRSNKHLGTPEALTDEQGEYAWYASFTSYGNLAVNYDIPDERRIDQPLRFQGQYCDTETGLHYNRHRYYDPQVGSFITPDPIKLLGGINHYQYVPNPIGWVDPLGLTAQKESAARQLSAVASPQRQTMPPATPNADVPFIPDNKDHQLIVGAYSSSKTGHAVVAIIEPDGSETMAGLTMSGYTGQKTDLLKAVIGSKGFIHSGTLAEVKLKNPDFSFISTPITKEQASKATDKIFEYDDKLDSGEYRYKLLSRQCAVFACDVSEAAGVKPPNAGLLVKTPKKLHSSIDKANK